MVYEEKYGETNYDKSRKHEANEAQKRKLNCCSHKGGKNVKYQLVNYHELPDYLRDNEYIKGHYRANWPLKQTFLSIFTIHNETLNVWTHLIGFVLFLWLTLYTAKMIPCIVESRYFLHLPDVIKTQTWRNISDLQKLLSDCLPDRLSSRNHTDICILRTMTDDLASAVIPVGKTPVTRWPFYAFLGGAMFCLLSSSICHLFCCHSERLSYVLLRLDYTGIAALISTSAYPVVYYSYMCYPLFRDLYMGFITVLGAAILVFSLFPAFDKPKLRVLRAVLFSGMGLSGGLPLLYKQILFWDKPEALQATVYEFFMCSFYALGALVYATRIPERWLPGRFDIVGHSHQLFHVLVIAGAYTHYRAGLVYLNWRDLHGC